MVTVITATGNPIQLHLARTARMQDGRLVCLDAAGHRLLSFDPLDVKAYAVEVEGTDAVWIMGGIDLVMSEHEPVPGPASWRIPERLRFTYR